MKRAEEKIRYAETLRCRWLVYLLFQTNGILTTYANVDTSNDYKINAS